MAPDSFDVEQDDEQNVEPDATAYVPDQAWSIFSTRFDNLPMLVHRFLNIDGGHEIGYGDPQGVHGEIPPRADSSAEPDRR